MIPLRIFPNLSFILLMDYMSVYTACVLCAYLLCNREQDFPAQQLIIASLRMHTLTQAALVLSTHAGLA